jgi:adenylate cyclase class 2
MALEIEKAYFEFDEESVKARLRAQGAQWVGKYVYRQVIYTSEDPRVAFARVRDEGRRTTLTVKRKTDGPYYRESEVCVGNFEGGQAVLGALGLKRKYYLEKMREIWTHGRSEVVFDTYPALPPYIEIEGPTEEAVGAIAKALGLREDDPQDRGAGEMYYDLYGITREREQGDLTFGGVVAALGPLVTKDPRVFAARAQEQGAEAARVREAQR